jgi:hypothetical protein
VVKKSSGIYFEQLGDTVASAILLMVDLCNAVRAGTRTLDINKPENRCDGATKKRGHHHHS